MIEIKLYLAVLKWVIHKNNRNDKYLLTFKEIIKNLTNLLLKLFIKRCRNLSYISLDTLKFDDIKFAIECEYLFNNNELLRLKIIKISEIYNKIHLINSLINNCKSIEEIIIILLDKDLTSIVDLIAELVRQQVCLQKFICHYTSLSTLILDVTSIVDAALIVIKTYDNLLHIEFTRCQFGNEITLFKFSCFRNFMLTLKDCKIHKKYGNDLYEYIDDYFSFISNYFNYISITSTLSFDFDESKKTNTIVVTTTILSGI